MAKINVNKLLRKKSWTGKEVGKALLASFAQSVKDKDHPLFTEAEFSKMINSLTPRQGAIYNVYYTIYSSLVSSHNAGQMMYQQFYNGYYRTALYIINCERADEAMRARDGAPLILTEKQYQDIKRAETEKRAKEPRDYRDVLINAVRYFAQNMDKAPEPVKRALEETKSQPLTNKRILANWGLDTGDVLYRLSGSSSGELLTEEEWKKAVEAEYMSSHSARTGKRAATYEETVRKYTLALEEEASRLLFENEDRMAAGYEELAEAYELRHFESPEEIREALNYIIDHSFLVGNPEHLSGKVNRSKWEIVARLPEGVTKFDILSGASAETDTEADIFSGESLLRYSGGFQLGMEGPDGLPGREISESDQFAEFKKDYPKVYKTVKEWLASVSPVLKAPRGAQVFNSKRYTVGQLAELGIGSYRQYLELSDYDLAEHFDGNTEADFSRRTRILKSGIAIIREGSRAIGPDGAYKEQDPFMFLTTLESLSETEADKDLISQIYDNLIDTALRYLLCHNVLCDILQQIYDCDAILSGKQDLSRQERQIESLNNYLYHFYRSVYGAPERKAEQRRLIHELFRPIDLEALRPSQERIENVRAHIEKLEYTEQAIRELSDFNSIINVLMGRGALYGE